VNGETHEEIARVVTLRSVKWARGRAAIEELARHSREELRDGESHHDIEANKGRVRRWLWEARQDVLRGDEWNALEPLGHGLHFIADSFFNLSGGNPLHQPYEREIGRAANPDEQHLKMAQARYPLEPLCDYIFDEIGGQLRPQKGYEDYGHTDYQRDYNLALMLCATAALSVFDSRRRLSAVPEWQREQAAAQQSFKTNLKSVREWAEAERERLKGESNKRRLEYEKQKRELEEEHEQGGPMQRAIIFFKGFGLDWAEKRKGKQQARTFRAVGPQQKDKERAALITCQQEPRILRERYEGWFL